MGKYAFMIGDIKMVTVTNKMTIQECKALGREPLYRYCTRWQTLRLQGRITEEYEGQVHEFIRHMKEQFHC